MSNHNCDAVIVSCIDFRFQPFINQWISDNFQPRTYDRVAWAGGVKNQQEVLEQIEISHRLHHIQKVFLINHEDCGAYGEEGTYQKHTEDLTKITKRIKGEYPNMKVELIFLHLDGTFEKLL